MKQFFFAIFAALLLCGCAQEKKAAEDNGFVIHRGTNVSHWLSQCEERGEAREKHITEADFKRLKDLGFDFVRLPIDEVQFWNEEGRQLPEAWTLLTNAVDWALKNELRVIVDLHIIRAHYFNAVNEGGADANTLFESEEAQQGLINLWSQLEDALEKYPTDMVAYEFMNEPVAKEHEQWNQLVAKVHKAIREREPERTLVIGSNLWQGTSTFKYLRIPEGDKNIVLSFHFYDPQILTHYGVWWNNIGKYRGPVTYPGQCISDEDFAQVPDSLKPELKIFTEQWDKDRLRSMMNDAIEVAKKHNLQLFCGEWGVYENVDREWAYRWTRDMMDIFNENGVAWATWCYDADFGFWDQKKNDFKDKKLLDILMGR